MRVKCSENICVLWGQERTVRTATSHLLLNIFVPLDTLTLFCVLLFGKGQGMSVGNSIQAK